MKTNINRTPLIGLQKKTINKRKKRIKRKPTRKPTVNKHKIKQKLCQCKILTSKTKRFCRKYDYLARTAEMKRNGERNGPPCYPFTRNTLTLLAKYVHHLLVLRPRTASAN